VERPQRSEDVRPWRRWGPGQASPGREGAGTRFVARSSRSPWSGRGRSCRGWVRVVLTCLGARTWAVLVRRHDDRSGDPQGCGRIILRRPSSRAGGQCL